MNNTVLKKSMGEGGALLDESHGSANLYEVLAALALASTVLTAYAASPSNGVLTSMVVPVATRLRKLGVSVADTGSGSTTTVQIRKNGEVVGSISIGSAADDGTTELLDLDVELEAGDVLDLNVSSAATESAGLTATAGLRPVEVE